MCSFFDDVNDSLKPETDGAEELKVLNVITATFSQLLNEKDLVISVFILDITHTNAIMINK